MKKIQYYGKIPMVWGFFLLLTGNISAQPLKKILELDPPRDSVEVIIGSFLGNEQRNYYGSEAPTNLAINWKFYLGKGKTVISRSKGEREWAGAGWTGQPLLVREQMEYYLIQGAYDHHLRKIRARDGKEIWKYAFDDVIKGTGTLWHQPDYPEPENSLVILQGSRLGVGNFLDSKHIPSYRAISFYTGKELWRLDAKWTHSYSRDVDGSALMLGDSAYIGFENSLFTVFDPDYKKASIKDGMLQPLIYEEHKMYTLEDVRKHKNNVVTESSPSLLGNHVYVASGAGRVWGYNLDTRALDWQFYIGSDIDGSAIVTSDSALLVSVEKQYIDGPGGIFKLNPQQTDDAAVEWYFPTGTVDFAGWEGGVIGSVGINDNYLQANQKKLAAFVGIDGYLYVVEHTQTVPGKKVVGPDSTAMYPTPQLIFKKKVGPSIATPVFAENTLVVPTYWGLHLFTYDADNQFVLVDQFEASFEATPIIWNNHIYIASRNGYFYSFGVENRFEE
ncbi:MAG: hypothetical protein R6U66_07970 [Bacteroidales bacterium]